MSKRRHEREQVFQLFYALEYESDTDWQLQHVESESGYGKQVLNLYQNNTVAINQMLRSISAPWNLELMQAVDRAILRLGLTELTYMPNEIPRKVAINEAIELAKKFGDEDSPGFVNALLDKVLSNSMS
jgi:N utilization substance protein B